MAELSRIYGETDKQTFVMYLLRHPDNPLDAAKAVVGTAPAREQEAIRLMIEWLSDTQIFELKDKLLAEYGEAYFMPTAAEFCKQLWDEANQIADPAYRLGHRRLYAEVRGFIFEKAPVQVAVNTTVDARSVFVVPDVPEDAWVTRAAEQQRKLIDGSTPTS